MCFKNSNLLFLAFEKFDVLKFNIEPLDYNAFQAWCV